MHNIEKHVDEVPKAIIFGSFFLFSIHFHANS